MEVGDLAQSFQSIIGGLQTLTSLSRKAEQQGLSDEFTKELNAAVINMQSAVMDAQSMTLEAQGEQSRLIGRLAELEEEVRRSNEWAEEKLRYELISLDYRLAYGVREDSRRENEAIHYLCTTCYENGSKSILQPYGIASHAKCLTCGPI